MQSKENLMKMFEMHNEGKTFAEIGRCFGITRERVRQIIGSPKKYPGRYVENCAFPSISNWLWEHGVSRTKMCKDLHFGYMTLCKKMWGRNPFTMPEIKAILAYTGLTFEEAFGEEIKPDRKED